MILKLQLHFYESVGSVFSDGQKVNCIIIVLLRTFLNKQTKIQTKKQNKNKTESNIKPWYHLLYNTHLRVSLCILHSESLKWVTEFEWKWVTEFEWIWTVSVLFVSLMKKA